MARYIDADKLIAHLKDEIEGCEPPFGSRANGKSIAYGTKLGLKSAISFAETLSTEDVVLRAELAVSSFRDAATIYNLQETNKKLKAEVAKEIFEDIKARSMYDFPSMYYTISSMALDELEKKYTE